MKKNGNNAWLMVAVLAAGLMAVPTGTSAKETLTWNNETITPAWGSETVTPVWDNERITPVWGVDSEETTGTNMPGLYVLGQGRFEMTRNPAIVRYGGKKYNAHWVIGQPCIYVPDLPGVVVQGGNYEGVLIESTKNMKGKKFVLLINGDVKVETKSNKSCIRFYYGDLVIDKPEGIERFLGGPSLMKKEASHLQLVQKDNKKGMFVSRGKATLKNIKLTITTQKNNDAISVEGDVLTVENLTYSSNGTIYANRGFKLVDCDFPYKVTWGYGYPWQKQKKVMNLTINPTKPAAETTTTNGTTEANTTNTTNTTNGTNGTSTTTTTKPTTTTTTTSTTTSTSSRRKPTTSTSTGDRTQTTVIIRRESSTSNKK